MEAKTTYFEIIGRDNTDAVMEIDSQVPWI